METMILLADDDAKIRELLRLYFLKEGFQVEEAADGGETLDKVRKLKPSLVVLDLMMPVMDGLEACRQIRQFSRVPIIMLTACGDDEERILGLDTGADDYIPKPFNPREVVARVRAVLRRQTGDGEDQDEEVLRFPELVINHREYRVTAFGNSESLTAKEMDLLWHLASHPGRVFSREQLLGAVWGYSYGGDSRTVDTHIKRVRQKLCSGEGTPWDIRTVWGVGYKFEVRLCGPGRL